MLVRTRLSPLEGSGFEPSVPLDATKVSRGGSYRRRLIPRQRKGSTNESRHVEMPGTLRGTIILEEAGDDQRDEPGQPLMAIDAKPAARRHLQGAGDLVGLLQLVEDLRAPLIVLAPDLGQA